MTKVTTLYNSEHQPINYLLINADKTETTVAYNKIQEFEEFLNWSVIMPRSVMPTSIF